MHIAKLDLPICQAHFPESSGPMQLFVTELNTKEQPTFEHPVAGAGKHHQSCGLCWDKNFQGGCCRLQSNPTRRAQPGRDRCLGQCAPNCFLRLDGAAQLPCTCPASGRCPSLQKVKRMFKVWPSESFVATCCKEQPAPSFGGTIIERS